MLDVSTIIFTVDKAREVYQIFCNADFALCLSKALYLLAQVASKELHCDIIVEMETICNTYICNLDILTYYAKTFKYVALTDTNFVKDKIGNLEKILLQKTKEDVPYDEIFKTFLFILRIKNAENEEKQLFDVSTDCIEVPTVYADTVPSEKKMNEILNHFKIYGTLDKPVEIISINNQYILLDGYARWFVAKNRNIEVIKVRLLEKY